MKLPLSELLGAPIALAGFLLLLLAGWVLT
jgi:hypothetical protein